MSKGETIIKILNHYKGSIYGGDWADVRFFQKLFIDGIVFKFVINYTTGVSKNISINQLLDPDSGFLQACKWKPKLNEILVRTETEGLISPLKIGRCWGDVRQYHAMMLSLLSQKEKVIYLIDNIIIDDNSGHDQTY